MLCEQLLSHRPTTASRDRISSTHGRACLNRRPVLPHDRYQPHQTRGLMRALEHPMSELQLFLPHSRGVAEEVGGKKGARRVGARETRTPQESITNATATTAPMGKVACDTNPLVRATSQETVGPVVRVRMSHVLRCISRRTRITWWVRRGGERWRAQARHTNK